jgi:hypothetical protein
MKKCVNEFLNTESLVLQIFNYQQLEESYSSVIPKWHGAHCAVRLMLHISSTDIVTTIYFACNSYNG